MILKEFQNLCHPAKSSSSESSNALYYYIYVLLIFSFFLYYSNSLSSAASIILSLQAFGRFQNLIIFSFEEVRSNFFYSNHYILVISLVWAFKTYIGIAFLAFQKVIVPSLQPTNTSPLSPDHSIYLTFCFPIKEADYLANFSLPGFSISKTPISPSSNPPVNT